METMKQVCSVVENQQQVVFWLKTFVKIVDIPEDEQKNYPDENNPGKFLTKKLEN